MKRQSKEITIEESRYLFMKQIVGNIRYWSQPKVSKDKPLSKTLESLAFSILNTLDSSYSLFNYDSEENVEFAKQEGHDHYPLIPDDIDSSNDIVTGGLHESLQHYMNGTIERPEDLYTFDNYLIDTTPKIPIGVFEEPDEKKLEQSEDEWSQKVQAVESEFLERINKADCKHVGTSLNDFLEEEGILEEVTEDAKQKVQDQKLRNLENHFGVEKPHWYSEIYDKCEKDRKKRIEEESYEPKENISKEALDFCEEGCNEPLSDAAIKIFDEINETNKENEMCSSDELKMMETTVKGFLETGKMFTAYDVTVETRNREGVYLRHKDVRNDINQMSCLADAVDFGVDVMDPSGIVEWEQTRVDMPNGKWAFVYHPSDVDPQTYHNIKGKPDGIILTQGGQNLVDQKTASITSFTDNCINDLSVYIPESYKTDSRGRLLINTKYLRGAGIKSGDDCIILRDSKNNCVLIVQEDVDISSLNGKVSTQRVERDGDIRLSSTTLKDALISTDEKITVDNIRINDYADGAVKVYIAD